MRQALLALALLALAAGAGAQNIGAPVLSEKAQERIKLPDAPAPQGEVAGLIQRADAAFAAGRYEDALPLYQRAASAAGGPATQAIDLTYRIGRTQAKLRRTDDALTSYERGMTLAAQAGATVQSFAEPLLRQAQGEALRAAGRPQLARAEYQRAFDGYAALGKEADVARMQAEIGSTYVDEANFSDGLTNYEAARRRMQAAGSSELGRLLVNTSSVLTWLGKYDDALALQVQAERACDAQHDATCQASAAHVQGFTRFQLADYEGAAAASRRAAQLFGPRQDLERARALNNLGLSLVALHQPKEGLVALKESMAILDKAGGEAKDKATTTDSIATAYRTLGDFKQAGVLYQDALVRWRSAGHREGERDTLANLGQLATDLKQTDASIFYYKLSVNLAQSLRANARQLEAGFLDSLTRRLAPSYQALASALVDQGRLAEAQQVMRMLKEQELFDFLRRGGPAGDTTAALTGVEQDRQSSYENIQLRVFQLARQLEELDAKPSGSLSAADKARRDQLEAQLLKAHDELEKFCVELQQALQADHAKEPPDIAAASLDRLKTTLGKLGHGAVLLHYVPLEDHLSIVLTGADNFAGKGYKVAVGRVQLNHTVETFRTQIQALDANASATARMLHGWLMPPALRRDLDDAGAKVLMVSLADGLRYLPFVALHDGSQWLAERYAVAMYPDAAATGLEQLPNPNWALRAFGMTQAAEGLPALTSVRSELEAIVGARGLPGSAALDADFTLDRLRDTVNQTRPPVLHIASHFVFRPGTEDESFLLLGVGRLTLTDLKKLRFRGLDLLTLSACDTGVPGGVNRNGAEIEGFAALARAQGADAVLATLWSVADLSTAAFMQAFYQSRRAHAELTKVEALQRTQLAMIRGQITASSARESTGARGDVEGRTTGAPTDYTLPFFWAPFVLVGNWL